MNSNDVAEELSDPEFTQQIYSTGISYLLFFPFCFLVHSSEFSICLGKRHLPTSIFGHFDF